MKNKIVILGLINESNRKCLEVLAHEGYQVDTLTLIDNNKQASQITSSNHGGGINQGLHSNQSVESLKPPLTSNLSTTSSCSAIKTVLVIVDTSQCIEVVDDFYDENAQKIPVLALIHNPLVYQHRESLYDKGVLDCILQPLIVHELLFKVRAVLHYSCCVCLLSNNENPYVNNAQAMHTTSPIKQSDQQLVTETCQYLLSHIDQKLNLDDVAITMGANRSKLSAIFKQVIGYGVFEWLREQRMLKARSLLMNSEMSIQAIGFEVGYENSANFSTVYKKYFDISPRQQRKSVKHEILTHSNVIHT